ncbi:hypothetical protein V1477_000117 [Vespula maculifrons]|uniref:Uncharacterized protein n=1 Tax=Vespula maculifrons TaxID=7453 RepID=A0ABD2D2Q2_VESMC
MNEYSSAYHTASMESLSVVVSESLIDFQFYQYLEFFDIRTGRNSDTVNRDTSIHEPERKRLLDNCVMHRLFSTCDATCSALAIKCKIALRFIVSLYAFLLTLVSLSSIIIHYMVIIHSLKVYNLQGITKWNKIKYTQLHGNVIDIICQYTYQYLSVLPQREDVSVRSFHKGEILLNCVQVEFLGIGVRASNPFRLTPEYEKTRERNWLDQICFDTLVWASLAFSNTVFFDRHGMLRLDQSEIVVHSYRDQHKEIIDKIRVVNCPITDLAKQIAKTDR